MTTIPYNRDAAVAYACKWALSRNPAYFNFETLGGDCTNFASQCIYAGAGQMNYTPVTGWFYQSSKHRTAFWTGVEYLYNFLIANKSVGPFAREVMEYEAWPGDVVQFGTATGHFYHSPVITAVTPEILVAAHTEDALNRPLASYTYDTARFLHIEGVRVW